MVAVAQEVRAAGMKVGVALKPATPVDELLFPYLDKLGPARHGEGGPPGREGLY